MASSQKISHSRLKKILIQSERAWMILYTVHTLSGASIIDSSDPNYSSKVGELAGNWGS